MNHFYLNRSCTTCGVYAPKKVLLFIMLISFGKVQSQQKCTTLNALINEFYSTSGKASILKNQFKIKQLTYLNRLQKYKIGSKLDVSLPYSKSIESILQPDGNLLYSQREFLNPIVTTSVFKKIPFTGGEIGLSSSLGYFQNFLQSNRQFTANWLNLL